MKELNLAIVIPVYNDWDCLTRLIPLIDKALSGENISVSLIAINDASTQEYNKSTLSVTEATVFNKIEIVNLNCNLGHQRAIATGLTYVYERGRDDAVVVMDADGEDNPADILRLIREFRSNQDSIIVARRDRRSEGRLFQTGYFLYKLVFRILTGQTVGFGNFSLIPVKLLKRLVYRDSLWNHLPATILRSRLPVIMVSSHRGTRLQGTARMNIGDLVLLGLSAVSVYIDKAFMRTLLLSTVLFISTVIGMGVVVFVRIFTDMAIPGWASDVMGSLMIILVLSLILTVFVLFIILANRSQFSMVPAKHTVDYVDNVETVYSK